MALSNSEEQLMEYIWQNEKIYMKQILDCYEEPKPATTTIATLLKRMQQKGFVGYELTGNSRAYFARVAKDKYFSLQVNNIISKYFDNSPSQFASFFTKETRMTKKQLQDLKNIINAEIKKKK